METEIITKARVSPYKLAGLLGLNDRKIFSKSVLNVLMYFGLLGYRLLRLEFL